MVDREPYEANFRYRLLSRTQSRVVVLAHAGLLAAERYLHVSDHAIYKFSLRLNGVQPGSSCCILEILARVLRDLEVVRRVQVVDHRVQVPAVKCHIAQIVLDVNDVLADVHGHKAVGS